ncbi:MAG: phosphoribosylformylglycinamidine synthase subunit PurL [Planctomycetes bacterium]|nr:phosphoribosylformylglycinamidine synthase subunit PurL [Planctomycetota bacterium]
MPDAWRVEVFRAPAMDDPEGTSVLGAIRELGLAGVESVRSGRGFLLSPALARETLLEAAREFLADPVLDQARVYAPRESPASAPANCARILVMRKPGVMDPVALTVQRALVRTGIVPAAQALEFRVATFRAYEVRGAVSAATLAEIGARVLGNETIDDVLVGDEGLHFHAPSSQVRHGRVEVPLCAADDERLATLSREGGLSLNLVEMRAIQAHYRAQRREPSACELETIAQTWSEHCKHKTFAGIIEMDGVRIDNLLKCTIKAATVELAKPWCVSVFHDNAGVIEFDQGWNVCFKVETHNHPSAIDPYGGAGTGVGGVIRDILGVGLGAKPIANTDAFFVGPADLPAEKPLPKGCMHPRRILRGVVAGVRDYGNRMGIPTVNGGVWFHEGYVANPLVYCGTVGLMPHSAATKSVAPGDAIVVAGGRTGRDGIHGATFSSAELHEESESLSSSAVQIGDAITEKRVLDALLVARDLGLYRGITDCGAGGLSSAVGEMSEPCGAEVELDLVPLKYPGLSPEEIWISEAQERMVLAVPPQKLDELLAVFRAEDVEATVIGHFNSTGKLSLRARGELVGELDLAFLHEGTPRPVRSASYTPAQWPDPGCPAPAQGHGPTVLALLGAPDSSSKEWIVRQYDHEVQGMSVLKPFVGVAMDGPGDAAVLQPLPSSRKGIALSCGANPGYGLLDAGAMAEAVIDEALRNAVAVGGDPARTAILDNFSWGNCDKPDRLGALVRASEACYRAAKAYGTPFISGKDSLNNEYRVGDRTLAIPPTLLISALAIVPDVARCTSMDLKRAGSRVYLVGRTRADFGGSAYLRLSLTEGGRVPRPDLVEAPRLFAALHGAIQSGLVLACHDLSEGGLALAAAEMAFAGDLGLELELARVPFEDSESSGKSRSGFDPDSARLYSESCSRFLVEVAEGSAASFERAFAGLPLAEIARVVSTKHFAARGVDGKPLFELGLEALRTAHQGTFHG